MKRTAFATLTLALLLAVAPAPPAAAQMVCGLRSGLLAELARQGESVRAIGLSGDDVVWELTATEDGGAWSLVRSTTDGLACLVAAGEGLVLEAPLEPGEKL